MSATVCVTSRNEHYLWYVLDALKGGADPSQYEVIIYDDNSSEPIEINKLIYPNVRVIHSGVNRGVAFGFDRLVEQAKYETIILMGGDVIVKNTDWLSIAEDYVNKYPYGIGCSVCLSGNPEHLNPFNPANDVKRYGATLLPYFTSDELPSDSPLLSLQYVVDMFGARWIKKVPEKDIQEVPMAYGAMYITNKSWFNYIHGWDTVGNIKLSGLSMWGGIEDHLCLKAYLYGGVCHVIKNLESLHIFNKFDDNDVHNGRLDHYWYSKMFIGKTLLSDDDCQRLVEKVYKQRVSYELPTLPFNLGKKMIRQNKEYVSLVRERNRKAFVHDFDWYLTRFNIEKGF